MQVPEQPVAAYQIVGESCGFGVWSSHILPAVYRVGVSAQKGSQDEQLHQPLAAMQEQQLNSHQFCSGKILISIEQVPETCVAHTDFRISAKNKWRPDLPFSPSGLFADLHSRNAKPDVSQIVTNAVLLY